MSRQVLWKRSPSSERKNRPLLKGTPEIRPETMETGEKKGRTMERTKTRNFGEVAGGTAAGCAAVCCCCPCAVVNLLVLAVYKVPVSLCKKARMRHRLMRKRKQIERSLLSQSSGFVSRQDLEKEVREVIEKGTGTDGDHDHHDGGHHDGGNAAVDLEKEMWGRFYGTGFWRSPSQRSTT